MAFEVDVRLNLRQAVQEARRTATEVQQALRTLRTSGGSGAGFGQKLSDIEIQGAASIQQLQSAGASQAQVAAASRRIQEIFAAFASLPGVEERLGAQGRRKLPSREERDVTATRALKEHGTADPAVLQSLRNSEKQAERRTAALRNLERAQTAQARREAAVTQAEERLTVATQRRDQTQRDFANLLTGSAATAAQTRKAEERVAAAEKARAAAIQAVNKAREEVIAGAARVKDVQGRLGAVGGDVAAANRQVQEEAAEARRRRDAARNRVTGALPYVDPGRAASLAAERAGVLREDIAVLKQNLVRDKKTGQFANEALTNQAEVVRLGAQKRALERQINRELAKQLRAEELEGIGTGADGGPGAPKRGTLFQRAQQRISVSRGEAPQGIDEYETGAAFLGRKALTTGAFAISGAAIYGVVAGLRQATEAALELQRTFVTIEAQFDSMNQGDQFEGFRNSMLDLSRETGIAATEVATVGFQMQGAFGDEEGVAGAVKRTEDAIKASVVTGLEMVELTDSLTAASRAYGVSIEEITDKAIGLEERFGVLARESLKVFGDMAIIASQAGLELNELGALVGVVQQASGRSGAAIAEGFGRILPAIQNAAPEIVRLYESVPSLRGSTDAIAESISGGFSGDVLVQLVRDYEKLDQATKNYVITLLGGRREAQILIPLFQNTGKVIEEFGNGQEDAGQTAQRFADIQGTISQQLARLRQTFLELGDALGRAGVFDALGALLLLLGQVASIVTAVISFFGDLNQATGGLGGRLLGLATAFLAVRTAMSFMRGRGIIGAAAETGSVLVGGRMIAPAAAGAGSAAATSLAAQGIGAKIAAAMSRPLTAAGTGSVAAGFFTALKTRFFALISAIGAFSQKLFPSIVAGRGGATGAAIATGVAAAAIGIGIPIATEKNLENASRARKDNEEAMKTIVAQSFRELQEGLGRTEGSPFEGDSVYGGARSGLYDSQRSLFSGEGIRRFFSGEATHEELADKQLNELRIQEIEQAMGAGIIGEDPESKKKLDTLLERLKAERDKFGGGKYADEGDKVLEDLYASKNQKFLDIINQNAANNVIIEDGGEGLQATSARATAEFQAGERTYDDYIAVLRSHAAALKRVVGGSEELRDKHAQAERAVRQAVQEQVQAQVNMLTSVAGLTGQDPAEAMDELTALLNNPELAPQAKGQFAVQFAGIMQQSVQRQIALAGSAAEGLKLLEEGIELPPELRAAWEESNKQALKEGKAPVPIPDRVGQGDEAAKRQQRKAVLQEQILGMQVDLDTEDPTAIANLNLQIAELELLHYDNETERLNAELKARQARREAEDALKQVGEQMVTLWQSETEDPALDTQYDVNQANADLAIAQRKFDEGKINVGQLAEAQAAANEATRSHRDALRDQEDARSELAVAQLAEEPLAAAYEGLAQATRAVERARGTGSANEDRAAAELIAAERNVRDVLRDQEDARRELIRAEIGDDPIAQANQNVVDAQVAMDRAGSDPAKQDRARAQMIQARESQAEAVRAEAEARREVARALADDNQVVLAQIDLDAANAAMAAAGNNGAKQQQALAQRILAERALADAFNQVMDSRLELAAVMADVSGDQVGAAQRRLELANAALQRQIREDPTNEVALNALRGTVAQAEAAVRDTNLSEQQSQIDFALQMEQITTDQAIQQLQALLNIPNLTAEQIRSLQLKIKGLQDDLSGSVDQFGIAPDIKLPTYYEVRRASGAGQLPAGAGIQDNRQINIQTIVASSMDAAMLVEQIKEAATGPSRTSGGARLY